VYLIMQFSKDEEELYNSLVNSKKKAVQVKYELTRPRKKQNKKGDEKKATVLSEYSTVKDHQEDSEHVYSKIAPKPPTRWDSLSVKRSSNSYKENDNFVAPLIKDNQSEINLPLPTRSPPKPPMYFGSTLEEISSNPTTPHIKQQSEEIYCVETNESSSIYAPWNWRQQDYESWTPSYKQTHDIPIKPPPKPPNVNDKVLAEDVNHVKQLSETHKEKQPETSRNYEPWNWRQQNYESWTPQFQKQESGTQSPSHINNNLKELGNKFDNLKIPTRRAPAPPAKSISPPDDGSSVSSQISHDQIMKTTPMIQSENIVKDKKSPNKDYEPWNWRRKLKEEGEELYTPGKELLPPPPSPPLAEESFSRGPLRKSKSILKEKKVDPGEKKKRVRMLFPEDTVSPI